MALYTGVVPPDTMRYCVVCNKETVFGYAPAIGHSRCRICGGNKHRGCIRTLEVSDFKKVEKNCEEKEQQDIEILRDKIRQQRKNIVSLNQKINLLKGR